LKPENVLLRFDTESERCIDVKLCDFGLSVKTRPGLVLTDFCGSPGFFAPEMIVHNGYFGDKADVWSTGCILLELILGHERFCDAWMSAYDFDVLQDKVRFEDMINSAVAALPDALEFPRDLKDFVLQFVKIRSSERPTIAELCRHTWLSEVFSGDAAAAELAEMSLSLVKDVPGPPDQDRVDSPSNFSSVTRKRSNDMTKATNLAKMAGSSFSERERRHYEEHNVHVQQLEAEGGGNSSHGGSSKSHTRPPSFDKRHSHDPDSDNQLQQEQAGEPKDFDPDGDSGSVGAKCAASKSSHSKGHIDHHTLHLPPIEPQTPSVGKFRKILKKADDLLPAGSEQRWQDSIEEEAKGAGANVTLSSGTGASLLGRHHDAPEADDRPLKLSPRQAALLSSSSDSRLPTRG
jgi:serine/threonine protein kinase